MPSSNTLELIIELREGANLWQIQQNAILVLVIMTIFAVVSIALMLHRVLKEETGPNYICAMARFYTYVRVALTEQ